MIFWPVLKVRLQVATQSGYLATNCSYSESIYWFFRQHVANQSGNLVTRFVVLSKFLNFLNSFSNLGRGYVAIASGKSRRNGPQFSSFLCHSCILHIIQPIQPDKESKTPCVTLCSISLLKLRIVTIKTLFPLYFPLLWPFKTIEMSQYGHLVVCDLNIMLFE